MTCADCIARSGDYVDGTIESLDRAGFTRHLTECEACARYVRVLRRGLAIVRELEPVQPSAEFTGRLHRRLHGLHEEQQSQARSLFAGATVTLALAASMAIASWLPIFSRGEPADMVASGEPEPIRIDASRSAGDAVPWMMPNALSPLVRPFLSPPPSMTAALPGPYSPLVVQPPAVGRSTGRAFLTAYLVE
ncbi:MAG: zf-HC2 domain-containing protein [Gemmatimonadetes bacterium]|nr:zf-HC2 domain-containing protein [Gemmatimonadota bacterium]